MTSMSPARLRASPRGRGARQQRRHGSDPAAARPRRHATCQAGRHAAWDDRTWSDGRQHGEAPGGRRAPLRRVRRRREGGHGGDEHRHDRRRVARGVHRQARRPPSRVDHGPGRVRRRDHRLARAPPRAWRHDHRRRELVVPRRHQAGPAAGRRPRHRLRRRRHERRRVRARARLLPDDRRPRRRDRPAVVDLRHPRPRRRRGAPHADAGRARRASVDRRTGLAALRAERRRPLREDGSQRHRVRDHGCLRRGPERALPGQRRLPDASPGRRDGAADRSAVLPVRHRPRRLRRGLATGLGDRQLAARPDGRRVRRRSPPDAYEGRVSDSGEGRWTIQAAIDEGVPVPVLATALFERFSSRGRADLADKVLSAMRSGFGGHVERKDSTR